ncbi:MalY/PatB family protein [Jannaschia seohaensis]|uniref:cysteine-S-conjugate beta-lyase n=1 Tax=Jannaschia seohaensis TaxID=475081 RepID=A0A2Y9ATE9_9RHOB|nr:MalY/PatB family protein [Jannaschia seohaensis]PWJ19118.1 cystathionine beta-lyase [Jannaschia seohaensis]SSA45757.1 cystathione beta-lyase [Jannaschia seohaensis]
MTAAPRFDKTADPRFDQIIDRRGTNCVKWDRMEAVYGVPAEDGLAMWVADMDFRPPACVTDALRAMLDHGIFGYSGDDTAYRDAIRWWGKERHGEEVSREAIFSTHGLVNGTGICVDTWTEPGDGVVLFTPVYHAFARVIKAAGRRVIECDLAYDGTRYSCDFDAWDAQMEGSGAKLMILCSPHNPNGRVWTAEELAGFAAFAKRHDLILVSDEIHRDIVFPGNRFLPMSSIEGVRDRLVSMTSTNKTFNIPGSHIGNVVIEDESLRAAFAARMAGLGISPNSFGLEMVRAAYSPEGAAWVDDLVAYIDGNRRIFDEGIAAIPGVTSVPLEATYLSWVDFSGTGMTREEFTARVEHDARIATNHGTSFGSGGDNFLRFNLGMARSRIVEAVERLQKAFGDLQ